MSVKLINPKIHKEWLSPHSFAWYAQIAQGAGKYQYSWNSTIMEPNGELLFAQEVSRMVQDKAVLDVGCGHGDFAIQWSPLARRIVGLDITSDFVKTGSDHNIANVSFVTANTRDKLPFEFGEFDCAYNRRGPTSAYLDLGRVVRKGGFILGLHPGDSLTAELPGLFPDFFEPNPEGTLKLDDIKNKLERGGFAQTGIETVTSVQYLHEPMDVVNIRCFGQSPAVFEMVIKECLPAIEKIFKAHAADRGLATTYEHYIVRAVV